MRSNLWYILKSLFIRNHLSLRTEIPHYPELTNFLKGNQVFRHYAWKFFHLKNAAIRNLDHEMLKQRSLAAKCTKGFKVKK
jgi:hypothetical protein